jgi:hypothetical protein
MDFLVQCGTTTILNRDLAALAERLSAELAHTGYVRDPSVVGNLLTRRLTLTARIEAGTPQTAITVAETALLMHLRGHGAEYGLVGIQHADATPARWAGNAAAPDAEGDAGAPLAERAHA